MTRADNIVKSGNFDDPDVESVLITAPSGQLDQTAANKAAGVVIRADARPRWGRGGRDSRMPVAEEGRADRPGHAEGRPELDDDRVQPLLDTTAKVQQQYPALRVEEVGGPSIDKALNETLGKDFKRAEMFSLPVTLAILLIAFGALIAAAVPLLLALSAVAAAIGLSAAASQLVPAVDAVNSVILLIGMAVGVDYSLFYLRREREERAKGRGHVDAVEIAAATSGHAVVVSGTAVIISMAGLFLARDAVFSSFAVGSILVVAVAVVGSLTVLPAMLAKLGRWVDRPRIPLLWRLTAGNEQAAVLADGAQAGPEAPGRHPAGLGHRTARGRFAGAGHEAEVPRYRGPAARHRGDEGVRPADRGLPEHRHQPRGRRTGACEPAARGEGRAGRAGASGPRATACSRRTAWRSRRSPRTAR